MTTLRLSMASDQIPDSTLQQMTRDLKSDIAQHTDASADLPGNDACPNHKGEPITLGVLLITLMSSGTAVALLNVLKSYLDRDRSVSFTIETPDGKKTTISANSLNDAEALKNALLGSTG